MPRPRKPLPLGQLSGTNERLQLLEKAGLSPSKRAELVRKFIEQAEAALEGAMNPLNPTQPDYHARMSAGDKLMKLLGANPPRISHPSGGQPQVAVVIEMPKWLPSGPQQAKAKVIDQAPRNALE